MEKLKIVFALLTLGTIFGVLAIRQIKIALQRGPTDTKY